jgi:two-component system, NarL family, invasion response regulator UvrY
MKILIADDHAIVRKGLIQIMNESALISNIEETNNGAETLELIGQKEFDIIVLDLAMPGMDGFELLREIKKEYPSQKILVLSSYPEERYAIRAIKEGAFGYLRKTSAPDELIKALITIADGHKYISSIVADELAAEVEHPSEQKLHEKLSDREYQIMIKIAEGKTLTEIADSLFISSKTVSTYRSRLMKKMKIKNNSELIKYVIDNDLIPRL